MLKKQEVCKFLDPVASPTTLDKSGPQEGPVSRKFLPQKTVTTFVLKLSYPRYSISHTSSHLLRSCMNLISQTQSNLIK